jgi:hypothetical protein
MWSKLVDIFTSLQKGTLKNLLTGAGVMLGTNVVVLSTFQAAVNSLRGTLNSVGADVLSLASLTGIDVGMALVLGAIVTRLQLNSSKLILKKM